MYTSQESAKKYLLAKTWRPKLTATKGRDVKTIARAADSALAEGPEMSSDKDMAFAMNLIKNGLTADTTLVMNSSNP